MQRRNAPKHLTSVSLWSRVPAIYVGSTYTRHAIHESRGREPFGSACSSTQPSRVAITTIQERGCRRRRGLNAGQFHHFPRPHEAWRPRSLDFGHGGGTPVLALLATNSNEADDQYWRMESAGGWISSAIVCRPRGLARFTPVLDYVRFFFTMSHIPMITLY